MKNNLYEKHQSPKVDDNSNPNKRIPIRAEEQEEPSKFVKFIKYSVIIAACVGIPFYMNTMPEVVTDFIDGFKDGAKESVSVNSTVALPNEIAPQPGLVSVVLSTTLNQLKRAASNPQLSIDEKAKIDAAIQKIEEKLKVDLDANQSQIKEDVNRTLQDVLANLDTQLNGIDQTEINSIINKSLSSALQGLEEFKQLDGLDFTSIPPIPPIPSFPTMANGTQKLDIPYIDYLAEMKKNGFLTSYKEYELKSFYDNGIDVSKVEEWRNSGLTELLKPWELVQMYTNNIDADELNPWIKGGFLKDYKSFEILQFIEKDVTTEYVSDFKKNGLDKKFKYYEISNFFENDVSLDQLNEWNKSGYLDSYKSHEIISFIDNDVPISFLKTLDQKGLLKDLKFYEVTRLYNESDN